MISLANLESIDTQSVNVTNLSEAELNGDEFAAFLSGFLVTPAENFADADIPQELEGDLIGFAPTDVPAEVLEENGFISSEEIVPQEYSTSAFSETTNVSITDQTHPNAGSEFDNIPKEFLGETLFSGVNGEKFSEFKTNSTASENSVLNIETAQNTEQTSESYGAKISPTLFENNVEDRVKISPTLFENNVEDKSQHNQLSPGSQVSNSKNAVDSHPLNLVNQNVVQNTETTALKTDKLLGPNSTLDPAHQSALINNSKVTGTVSRGRMRSFIGADSDIAAELEFRAEVSSSKNPTSDVSHEKVFNTSGLNESKNPQPNDLPKLFRKVSDLIDASKSADAVDTNDSDIPTEATTDTLSDLETEEFSLLNKVGAKTISNDGKTNSKIETNSNPLGKISNPTFGGQAGQVLKTQTIENISSKFNVKQSAVADQIETPLLELTSLTDQDGKPKSMKFRLNPAELGYLEIRLEKNASGKLDIQFITENASAKEILAESFEKLRSVMQNAGWQVEQLEVSTGSLSSNDFEDHEETSRQEENAKNRLKGDAGLDENIESEVNSEEAHPERLVNLRA